MKHLKVALSDSVQCKIGSLEGRICVPVCDTDFIDVGAVVIGDCDLALIDNNQIHTFGIPVIVLSFDESKDISFYKDRITSIIEFSSTNMDDCKLVIEKLVASYEDTILPAFLRLYLIM